MIFDVVGTSLSALDQIQGTKSKARKRLWTVAFLIATTMALYQSTGILKDYFDISMKELETIEFGNVEIAATVCVNDPFPNKDVIASDKKLIDILNKMRNISSDCDPENPTLFCLSLLSERERFAIGAPIEKQIYMNKFDVEGSYDLVNAYNNLYYGNCATLVYFSQIRRRMIQIDSKNVNNPTVVVLHRRNAVPVFNAESLIISNIHYTQITIYEETTTLLVNKACADEKINQMELTDGQNNSRYSIYSYESCLDQCLHNLTKEYCKCIRPQSLMEINAQKLPICKQWCNLIPNDEMETLCQCKPPCQQIKILPKKQFIEKKNAIADVIYELKQSKTFSPDGEIEMKHLIGYVKGVKSHIVIIGHISSPVINKQLPTKLEDALSVMGGIWGLWIGLSVSVILHSPSVIIQKIKNGFKKSPKTNVILDKAFKIISSSIWICIVMLITASSIWQVHLTIQEYFNYKVIQVTTTEDLNTEFFPTVVACSDTKVHFSQRVLNNSNLSHIIQFFNQTIVKGYDNPKELYYYKKTTFEEKIELLPRAEDFITSCEYRLKSEAVINCTAQNFPIVIDDRHFRPCAFINPAFAELVERQSIRELKVRFSFLQEELYPTKYKYQYAKIAVGFHPIAILLEGCPDCSGNMDLVTVSPGDHIDAKYSVKQFKRLPHPYTSDCINETADYPLWPKGLKEILPPYGPSYNYEDCLLLCGLNQLEKKGLFSLAEGIKLNRKSYAEYGLCECKLPCKFEDYEYQISQSNNVYKQNYMLKKYKNYEELMSYVCSGFAILRLSSASSSMKVITEEPLIKRDSLVGLVGGIFGLWIGVSILSLLVTINNILAHFFDKLPLWLRHLRTKFQKI